MMNLQLTETTYHGYRGHTFDFEGHTATIIYPEKPTWANQYIWRTEFLGAFDQVDVMMLRRGYHLVNLKISDMYGCPEAVEIMYRFQALLEEQFSLPPYTMLFGFSRGGLYAVNYAAAHPEKVDKIYLDAPVLDIFSWPAGMGEGSGSPKEWEECKQIYGITEADRNTFRGNPLDKIDVLLKHRIPIVLVAGEADTLVPYRENGRKLYAEYLLEGGPIQLYLKPDCGHHPHSLEDPMPVVRFLMWDERGAFIDEGPSDWQILQQDEDGFAPLHMSGHFDVGPEFNHDGRVVCWRLVNEAGGVPIVHWTQAQMDGQNWTVDARIPVGGLYRIETAVGHPTDGFGFSYMQGNFIHHIGVGDLYIVAGQSNAAGYGRDYIEDAPELGIALLKNNGCWDMASHPIHDDTDTMHKDNRDGINGYSPWLRFAKILKRELGYPIGLISTARGGAGLFEWNPAENGNLYINMMYIMKEIHGSTRVKGVLWYQGCTDSEKEEWTATYGKRFADFVAAWRKDFNQPDLPFLTAQIASFGGDWNTDAQRAWGRIREAQRMAAKEIDNVFVSPIYDATLSDPCHIDAPSAIRLGERMAYQALESVYKKSQYYATAPSVIDARRTDDTHIRLRFDHVYGSLYTMGAPMYDTPFVMEDETGFHTPASVSVPEKDVIELGFNAPVGKEAFVHHAYEKNCHWFATVDFENHLPALAFYGLPVLDKE